MNSVTSYPFLMAVGATFRIPAGGTYFRIQSATGPMNVTIEGAGTLPGMQSGQGIKDTPFDGLILRNTHTAINSGTILVANEEFIDNRTYGVNDLSTNSLDVLRRPLASTGDFGSLTSLAAGAVETVFAPASNVSGAIVLTAQMVLYTGSTVLISNTAAPTSGIDGSNIATVYNSAGGAIPHANTLIQTPQFLAAGQGLYFYCVAAENAGQRFCRFRLL